MPASSRLPRLGGRGEGWVAIQIALMAVVGLAALVDVYWPDSVAGVLGVLGLILIAAGLVFVAVAGISLLIKRAATVFPRPRSQSELARHGVYRIVRHPIYGALLLIAVGWSLAVAPLGLIPTFLLAIVFDLKARIEEAWLTEHHAGYAAYRERTPRRFVPGFY
jgi:protein-S-isoprenylcysteine O-methyltransferase Ste14